QVFKIEMNYRSLPEILEVANAAITSNVEQFRKNLAATRDSLGVKPAVVALNDGSEQAQFIAQRLLELRDENVDLNEIAVLYRLQLRPAPPCDESTVTIGQALDATGAHAG